MLHVLRKERKGERKGGRKDGRERGRGREVKKKETYYVAEMYLFT